MKKAKASNKNAKDSAVGYGRPPKHAQFKKGHSGNPKGRPKGKKNLNTLFAEYLGGRVRIDPSSTKTISRSEFIVRRIVHNAMKGDPRAIKLIQDYIATPEGRDNFQPIHVVVSEQKLKLI